MRWRSLEGGLGREKWVREREAARLRANSNREVLHVVSTCAMAAPSWVGRRGMEESGRGEPHQSQTSINRSPVTWSHMQKSADRYRHWPIQWITGVCSLTLSSSVRWDPALLYVPIAVTEIFSPKKLPVVYYDVIGAVSLFIARGCTTWSPRTSPLPCCPIQGRSTYVWAQPDKNTKKLQSLSYGPFKGPENDATRGFSEKRFLPTISALQGHGSPKLHLVPQPTLLAGCPFLCVRYHQCTLPLLWSHKDCVSRVIG